MTANSTPQIGSANPAGKPSVGKLLVDSEIKALTNTEQILTGEAIGAYKGLKQEGLSTGTGVINGLGAVGNATLRTITDPVQTSKTVANATKQSVGSAVQAGERFAEHPVQSTKQLAKETAQGVVQLTTAGVQKVESAAATYNRNVEVGNYRAAGEQIGKPVGTLAGMAIETEIGGKAIGAATKSLTTGKVALKVAEPIVKGSIEAPVMPLEVGIRKEMLKRSPTGDNIDLDHVPGFAQMKKAKEAEIGRELTKEETYRLYDNSGVIALPKEIHADGRTFKGRNTPTQIAADAINLCKAACRDIATYRPILEKGGYSKAEIDQALAELIKLIK